METSLHQQLKERFREPGSQIEVKIGRYRIDVVNGDRLVEIQRSGLASIRDKIAKLVKNYKVDLVKPLVVRKRLIKLNRKDGSVIESRWSPRRGSILDLFDELLYFTRVFPHPNLRLIAPLIEIEEIRYPGHGRRRRHRNGDFQVKDRLLTSIHGMQSFETAQDLHRLLPPELESPFDTGQLAAGLEIKRWQAQRIAYVLQHTGSSKIVGKKGNANLFELVTKSKKRKKARRSAKEIATAKKIKTTKTAFGTKLKSKTKRASRQKAG